MTLVRTGKPTINQDRSESGFSVMRFSLRNAWARPSTEHVGITPFRRATNTGLSNRRFVSDASDYTRYRKENAFNHDYVNRR